MARHSLSSMEDFEDHLSPVGCIVVFSGGSFSSLSASIAVAVVLLPTFLGQHCMMWKTDKS